MKYIISYSNPNNIYFTDPHEAVFYSKTEARAFLNNARTYSGSYYIHSITKTLKSGKTTEIEL